MTRTPLGALLHSAGWLSVGAAFVAGSLAPALYGIALVACAEAARRHARATRISATRDLPRDVQLGRPFYARLQARSTTGDLLRVEDDVPTGLEVRRRDTREGRGVADERLLLRPTSVGRHVFKTCTVHHLDPWGLHRTSRQITVEGTVDVAPDRDVMAHGRRAGRRGFQDVVAGRVGHTTSSEVEGVRAYLPGDRLRDVDWRRSSRMPGLYTKQRERVTLRPMSIVLDGTESMRWLRRHAKITTAARVAAGLAAAARTASVEPRLVVASPERVAPMHAAQASMAGTASNPRSAASAASRATRATVASTVSGVASALAELPPAIPVDRLPDVEDVHRRLAPEERRALRRLGQVQQGPANDPWQVAIARVARTPESVVVVLLDAESQPEATIRRMHALSAKNRCLLVVPATGSHHFTRTEVDAAVLRRLAKARRNRAHVVRAMDGLGVPTLVLHPDNVDQVIDQVVQWAS